MCLDDLDSGAYILGPMGMQIPKSNMELQRPNMMIGTFFARTCMPTAPFVSFIQLRVHVSGWMKVNGTMSLIIR